MTSCYGWIHSLHKCRKLKARGYEPQSYVEDLYSLWLCETWYKGTEYRKSLACKAGQTSRDAQRTNKNTTSVH